MNLSDGSIAYQRFNIAEFTAETATWSPGIHGVICDNASDAYDNLAQLLISYNIILSRSLNVYNYDSDTLTYYRVDPERFEFNFDRIHRTDWRRFALWYGKSEMSQTNEQAKICSSYLKHKYISESSYGLLFLSLPRYITEVDFYGSQIAYDYTYGVGRSGYGNSLKNMEMRRNSNLYYVYDQDKNFFYKFPIGE